MRGATQQPGDCPCHNPTSAQPSVTVRKLSHPPWVTLISRIPRAARASSAALLSQILRKIIASPNDKVSWRELLTLARSFSLNRNEDGQRGTSATSTVVRLPGTKTQCQQSIPALHMAKAPGRRMKATG